MRKPTHGHCHYCEIPIEGKEIEWDHKVPKIKGGKKNSTNLVICCVLCNRIKGSMDYEMFVALLKKYPINRRVRELWGGLKTNDGKMRQAMKEWRKLVREESYNDLFLKPSEV